MAATGSNGKGWGGGELTVLSIGLGLVLAVIMTAANVYPDHGASSGESLAAGEAGKLGG